MIHHFELKEKDVDHYTVKVLEDHLDIKADGYCFHTDMILDILIKASCSVEAVCADLEDTADSNTIREYLDQSLAVPELRQQETRANEALANRVPSALDREGVELAMDFHDEPFYGKHKDTRKLTCNEPRFRLHHFSRFLVRTIENRYCTISAISAFRSP